MAASLSERLGEVGPAMAPHTSDALISALEADRALLRVLDQPPIERAVVVEEMAALVGGYLGLR